MRKRWLVAAAAAVVAVIVWASNEAAKDDPDYPAAP